MAIVTPGGLCGNMHTGSAPAGDRYNPGW